MNAFDLTAELDGFVLGARASWTARTAALFGASGSGKSTVLEAIAGVREDVRGTVRFEGEEISRKPSHERGIGWVPQDAMLFPDRSVRANLAFAARWRGSSESVERAVRALDLGPLLERRAAELSGGERQRVAIGRALASEPRLLLLDEPLASIDRPLRSRLVPYLRRIPDELGLPLLVVSHDPLEVAALAEHVIVMADGRVVQEGDPREVFHSSSAFGAFDLGVAENRFEVVKSEAGAGTLTVETRGGARLVMAVVSGFPSPARVLVKGEDIVLSAEPPGRVSAQNVLVGEVESLEPLGEQIYVSVHAGGEAWRIKVTQRAVSELALAPGARVHLMIKAHAVFGG